MISFKQFLLEVKLLGDWRSNKNSEFYVSHERRDKWHQKQIPSQYSKTGLTWVDDDEKGIRRMAHSHMGFHDADDYKTYVHPEGYNDKADMAYPYNAIMKVDPANKKIHLNMNHITRVNDRRGNYTLGKFKDHKNETPIIPVGNDELRHSHFKQLLKSVNKHHPIMDYTVHDDSRYEGRNVSDIIKEKTPQEKLMSNEPITVWHGTSEKKASQIMKTGFKPGQRSEHEQYSDLVKGYSNKNLYLSTTPSEAANYATREAINDRSKAVILKTTIHPKDFHKIRPDEDSLHWSNNTLHPHVIKQLIKKHPAISHNDKEHFNIHFKNLNYENPKWNNYLDTSKIPEGKTEDEYRSEIGNDFKKAFISKHMNLDKTPSFAFTGNIHPKHIEVHKVWKTKAIKRDAPDHEYDSAVDHMIQTVTNKIKMK